MFHLNCNLGYAQRFIKKHHRHSKPLKRHMFSIAVCETEDIWQGTLGVVTVDRCSSAWSKHNEMVEIRRLCVIDGAPKNTASFLLSKAREACFAMGYLIVVTYTKPYESGASLRAAGFQLSRATWVRSEPHHPKGLVRWISYREHRPDVDDIEFTNDTLMRMKDEINNPPNVYVLRKETT